MQIIAEDGTPLHFEDSGRGHIPLLLLHGFTGTAANWDGIVDLLGDRWRVIRPTLRGHNGSWREGAVCSMDACVADIETLLVHLGMKQVMVCGYSMGGRLALYFALTLPYRVSALAMAGGSPGILGDAEREARRQSDEALAASIERDGLEPFVDRWMAQPLFASQARLGPERLAIERAARLVHSPSGLAASLRGMGSGTQPSLWPRLHEFRRPALVMAGEEDEKFAEIAVRVGRMLPDAHVELVPAAGHAIHLEQPAAFVAALRRFAGEE